MKIKLTILSLIFFLFLANEISAQVIAGIDAYRKFKDFEISSIKTPTVVEVPFSDQYIERLNFAVVDKTYSIFEPYFLKEDVIKYESSFEIYSEPFINDPGSIIDSNMSTYTEFPLDLNNQSVAKITLTSTDSVTSSALTTLLDNFVAMPDYIEIRAMVGGQSKIILAKKELYESTINFPKTTSNQWMVTYWYSQPLRISELKLIQEDNLKNITRSVRFLAQPGHTYRIYFDPDRHVATPVGESANLAFAQEVKKISNTSSQNNPSYIIADTDSDGVPDVSDNCISSFNPDQADININGRGDSCDDFDQDMLGNEKDNCPNNPNADQRDTDGDGIGDVCDDEESRVTEKYPWLPWLGIGFAFIVLIGLFVITARSSPSTPPSSNNLG